MEVGTLPIVEWKLVGDVAAAKDLNEFLVLLHLLIQLGFEVDNLLLERTAILVLDWLAGEAKSRFMITH